MNNNNRRQVASTFNHVNAGLAAGTTTTTTTTASTVCSIGGKFATAYASASNAATPTTDVNTGAAFATVPVNYGSVFVYGVNAAGSLKVAKGTNAVLIGGVTTTPGSFVNDVPQFPILPDDFCPIGYVVVKIGPSGSAWTFGSSNWTATAVTTSFVNCSTLPDRPQIS